MRLNLGCSDTKIPGFIGVDVAPPADQLVDLCGPWPWPDGSIEEVLARDVLEHIGNCNHVSAWGCDRCKGERTFFRAAHGFTVESLPLRHWSGKAHSLNELWRVLQPGGIATIGVPDVTEGDGGFCDCTHEVYWSATDFEYYEKGEFARERFRNSSYYGVKADFEVMAFEKIRHQRKRGFTVEIRVKLRAIK